LLNTLYCKNSYNWQIYYLIAAYYRVINNRIIVLFDHCLNHTRQHELLVRERSV